MEPMHGAGQGSGPGSSHGHEQGPVDLVGLWPGVVDGLPPNQRVWLSSSKPLMLAENTAVVAVPNEFTRTQLEGRLRIRIEDALSDRIGRPVRLAVSVDPSLETEETPSPSSAGDASSRPGGSDGPSDTTGQFGGMQPSGAPHRPYDDPRPSIGRHSDMSTKFPSASLTSGIPDSPLNPRYSFETFVIGSSNRFAHAAAVAVAEAPGKAYNPLLVYGDSGLGKTHLLHAIGHYVRNLWTGAKIRYVSSEAFTNDVINAIKDANTAALQRRYRDVDVLLVDDIQFLEGKQQTQEEFFHTFNTLHNANKQIVISSDRPPKRLTQLEDRLRNRFEWGLLTDVQPPDLET
ncbi:MAG: chromosomal replication initiator protein DnaA, partial [Marmoricola sp.]|nr:chromosomal replication initiator protein DnaA [Marmoricola sp.]